jgi:hypothetical protein
MAINNLLGAEKRSKRVDQRDGIVTYESEFTMHS